MRLSGPGQLRLAKCQSLIVSLNPKGQTSHMQKNLRYSITLNEAQLDYLSDEQQEIHRIKCFKTFLQMTIPEENKVYGKNFSAVLQPGQFVASKVDLARLWGCDLKTATRIVQEFNQLGILRSEPSNRTTIHTMICLSAWFEYRGMIRSRFFVSNPVVKPIVKPVRTTKRVPPETAVETNKSDCANPPDPGGTS